MIATADRSRHPFLKPRPDQVERELAEIAAIRHRALHGENLRFASPQERRHVELEMQAMISLVQELRGRAGGADDPAPYSRWIPVLLGELKREADALQARMDQD